MEKITDEAKRFKSFRQAENLTQKEFGALLGKTESWVSKAESGSRNIGLDEVKILHEKLKMSYEWFYHGKGNRLFVEKDQNLIKVTTDLQNKIDLLTQKVEKQDQILKKIVRDYYAKD